MEGRNRQLVMQDTVERLQAALPERYSIVSEIARGGAAVVYLARESHPSRDVAIKVLDDGVAAVLGRQRFLREVDVVSNLTHPHVVPIFAAGEADSFLYYVMPYIAGESLRERLKRERRLALRDALQITCDVAGALGYAHRHDIVHRDIKPENILLAGGEAVVADFGIARAFSEAVEEHLTKTGFVVGTPAYMSPEQFEDGVYVDGRSDLYSLGCVLYEMLAGRPPFVGTNAWVLMAHQLSDAPPSLQELCVGVPESVELVIAKSLAKAPDDRFATGEQLIDAIVTTEGDETLSSMALPPAGRSTSVSVGRLRTTDAEVGTGVAVALPTALTSRIGLTLLLAAVFAVNWIETTADNWVGARAGFVPDLRRQVAKAVHAIEGNFSFAYHDATNDIAAYGYSSAYFFFFPLLILALAAVFARREEIAPYRVFSVATMIVYAVSLPFYVLFPVPERWAYPESGAMLLSDRWSSQLIEIFRPISGLDNSFPSFHVSLTVLLIILSFVYQLRFRWSVFALGMTIVLSTFVLGIHWIVDIVGGLAVGVLGVILALRLEHRWAGHALRASG